MDDLATTQVQKDKVLTLPDLLFLAYLLFCIFCVVWTGHLAYQEGMHNEITKRNGEQWMKWFTQADQDRGQAHFQPLSCGNSALPVSTPPETQTSAAGSIPVTEGQPEATLPATPPPPLQTPPARTWGSCLKALTAQGGLLAGIVNPFNNKPMALVPKCDMADRHLAGNLVLEKIQQTPPGSAIPTINSPLTESDLIEQKMQIRITVCDKGAYPIRIAELEF